MDAVNVRIYQGIHFRFADEEALKRVRRSYHTLKGSGRMVGARQVGQVAGGTALAAALHRALDTLPTDQRIAFVLCEIDEGSG